MTRNSTAYSPMRPLTIGNVVNAALQLYNSNRKTYFQLALVGTLWLFVPIYGWAKYFATSALISRLAFGELIGQPESVEAARNKLKPRLWSFLWIAFGVSLRLLLIYLGIYIGGAIAGGIIFVVFRTILGPRIGTVIGVIGIIGIVIAAIILLIRYYSRWAIAEVPLAVEENINDNQSIKRSWELTKSAVGRIQGIVMIAFLVTLPIQALTSLPQLIFPRINPFSWIYWLFLVLSIFSGALVMPFWQSIKAVIYYDLRTRREGLDLQLQRQDVVQDEDNF